MREVKTAAQEIPWKGEQDWEDLVNALPFKPDVMIESPAFFVGWAAALAVQKLPPGYVPRRVIIVGEKAE